MPRRSSRGSRGADTPLPSDYPPSATSSVTIRKNNEGIASAGPHARNVLFRVEGEFAYRIARVPRPGRNLYHEPWREQPSQLLLVQHQIVPFTGRHLDLAELVTWRDDPGGPENAVRLLYGRGGQGKTRLALKLAAVTARDWRVWQATTHVAEPATRVGGWTPRSLGRQALIIVDYAERWPALSLVALLEDLASRPAERRRVLLIARSADNWWLSLRHDLRKMNYGDSVQWLGPLDETTAGHGERARSDRLDAYLAARKRFAEALGLPDPEAAGIPGNLRDPSFDLTLTVHMAALVAVDAQLNGTQPPSHAEALSEYLLDRERAYWARLHADGAGRVKIDADTMAQVVYTATLTGRLSYDDGRSALQLADIESMVPTGSILKNHALAYPADTAGSYLEPLYPDRLGEDFIALTTPGRQRTDTKEQRPDPVDQWADKAIARLLALPEEDHARAWTRHTFTVVIETARRWPHIASDHLYPLLRRQPRLALEVGGAALAALSSLPNIDVAVLEGIAACLPGRHTDLDVGMAALEKRLGDYILTTERSSAKRAQIYRRISRRMRNAGLDQLGADPAEHAVLLYRDLARSDPAHYQEALADALDGLGIHLHYTDQDQEALTATREATDILRELVSDGRADLEPTLGRVLANMSSRTQLDPSQRLATAQEAVAIGRRCLAENPEVEGVELAGALENLSLALNRQDRQSEAVAAAQEALSIRREQAGRAPEVYGPDLARTLYNVASRLVDTGRLAESIALTAEAVNLYRRLAAADPPSGEPVLAESLFKLGYRASEAGRHEDAIAAYTEAVGLYRGLAATDPDAYQYALANSLNNLGVSYAEMQDREQALTVTAEAVDLYRRLAAADPASGEPDLARALRNLASRTLDVGRNEDAVAAFTEVVGLYRSLAEADPDAYQRTLANSLNNLGNCYAEAQDGEQALTVTAEAVDLYRRLAAADPASGEPALAAGLFDLGYCAAEAGRHEDAVTAAAEAVGLYRSLAEADPDAYQYALANSLNNLGVSYAEMQDREQALTVTAEAVDLYRRLAAADPASGEPDLARALRNLASRALAIDRHDDAVAAYAEAVGLYRSLAAADPASGEPALAAGLFDLGYCAAEAGRHEDAVTAYAEAVGLYRSLAEADPDAYQYALANSLNNLGVSYAEMQDREQALTVTAEAVDLYRRLAAADPASGEPALAAGLFDLGHRAAEAGRHEDAVTAAAEAVDRYRRLAESAPDTFDAGLAALDFFASLRDETDK